MSQQVCRNLAAIT